MSSQVDLPKYHEFHWPIIEALRSLGGSATIEELNSTVIKNRAFTENQQSVLHHDGPTTEIEYRIAWGRTYLKGMGLAINSERGVWTLTEHGHTVTLDKIEPLRKEYLAQYRKDAEDG
ncbi:winged helix-turn-helix domain-containing protein [Ornithinimicrobium cryptoxanthini]|uniref:winged helix-turn-helix domain-containing protein n=1 Tax=Ornithinimicrobium cryptoxanthini TaxID=2934161 RepID=UPI002118C0B2|nr:winged helix-turn-helix domain-containing protein [Ornithinimicrobium cryptoxanthini]